MSTSIDNEVLDQIRELQSDSDPDVLVTLLRLFLVGIPQKMARIEAAIRNRQVTELRHETHSLKSSSGNLGAIQMARYCTELETLARAGDLSTAESLYLKLKTEVSHVVRELESVPEMQAFKRKCA